MLIEVTRLLASNTSKYPFHETVIPILEVKYSDLLKK